MTSRTCDAIDAELAIHVHELLETLGRTGAEAVEDVLCVGPLWGPLHAITNHDGCNSMSEA